MSFDQLSEKEKRERLEIFCALDPNPVRLNMLIYLNNNGRATQSQIAKEFNLESKKYMEQMDKLLGTELVVYSKDQPPGFFVDVMDMYVELGKKAEIPLSCLPPKQVKTTI